MISSPYGGFALGQSILGVRSSSETTRQGGFALAIVMWFIAGMALLAAGIVGQARVDVQMAQLHISRAKVVAAGDGAIQLMMADLTMNRLQGRGQDFHPSKHYQLGDLDVLVSLVPSAGLIDLNGASEQLLEALFIAAGRLSKAQAKYLASSVVNWRSGAAGSRARLFSIEDLMRVPGMTRTLLDSIRNYVAVGDVAGSGMNWTFAPDEVKRILKEVDPRRVEMLNKNDASKEVRVEAAYRADAIVQYGDRIWIRRLWLQTRSRSGSRLPWRVQRIEPPRVLERHLHVSAKGAS